MSTCNKLQRPTNYISLKKTLLNHTISSNFRNIPSIFHINNLITESIVQELNQKKTSDEIKI